MKTHIFTISLLLHALFAYGAGEGRVDPSVIKDGDVIRLTMLGVPKDEQIRFNGDYIVDGEGTIKLPMIGTVSVEGLLPEQASMRIEKLLNKKNLRNTAIKLEKIVKINP